ncbi:hypothetical protein ABT294_06130 [Nonomuraea sp. NPDC000554]|uniref:hypothetical protein n=1 Tax=Nonomuraea sp. NPDC000554 TaxID=3154259 RepID=UPI0033300B70
MRGPGSEHERRESDGSATPATPPPSFGQQPPTDQNVPQPDDTSPGNEPSGPPPFEAWSPDAWRGVPQTSPPEPVAGESGLPAFPGAQPWEVSEDDAAPYDWFADSPDESALPPTSGPVVNHDHPPVTAGPTPADASPWAPPGAPPWEPPPAFTAAAAGMQVWPPGGPPAMPPWPAATGELDPDTEDEPASGAPAGEATPATPQPLDPYATAPRQARWNATTPEDTDPNPTAPRQAGWNATTPEDTDPNATAPRQTGWNTPTPEDTDPNPTAPRQAGWNTTAPEDTDPNATAPHQLVPNIPPPQRLDPNATAPHSLNAGPSPSDDTPPSLFDPNVQARPAEPGDVPVWPPLPAHESPQGDQLPELPFGADIWSGKPTQPATRTPLALPPAPGDQPTPPHGAPAFPPGAFKQPQFQLPPPAPQRGRSRKALLVTLGVLAMAGVATGGFFAYKATSSTPSASPAKSQAAAPTPTASPSTSPPPEQPSASMLNSEETDPKKLSLTEAFPQKKIQAAGSAFDRVKTNLATNCGQAAAGPFADALREQKCSRVLRATYVDSKKRYAVTTGIAVLPTRDAAIEADQAKNLGRNLWFRALPAAAGTGGDRVHIAGGYAAGLVWGRYIVFSYATYADGHTPTSKEKALSKLSSAFRDQMSLVLERRLAKG